MHPNPALYNQDAYTWTWTQTTAAALVLLVLACAQAASAEPVFSVSVPGKTITLAPEEWIKMKDPTTVGKNIEERKKGPRHQFGRVVTIVPIPMSNNDRIGLKISASEYVEIFIVHPEFVTVQTRVDNGTYWVMCRETFLRKAHAPPVDLSPHKSLGTEDRERLWFYTRKKLTRHATSCTHGSNAGSSARAHRLTCAHGPTSL